MRKVLVLLIMACFVLGPVGMAAAEDRLSLDGDIQVRAFNRQNEGNKDVDEDDNYWEQRLRLRLAIRPMDQVTLFFRADINDGKWGDGTNGDGGINFGGNSPTYTGPSGNSEQGDPDRQWQFEEVYGRVNTDMYTLLVGLHNITAGMGSYYSPRETGISLRLKLPVDIFLNWMKVDENDSLSDDEDDGHKDTDAYMIQVSKGNLRKGKAWGAYGGMLKNDNEGSNEDFTRIAIGAFGAMNLGPVRLSGQVDHFMGEDSSDNDYVGTDLYLDASMNVSKAVKVGAHFNYGTSADPDEDEVRLYEVIKDGGGPWYNMGGLCQPGMEAIMYAKTPNNVFSLPPGPGPPAPQTGTIAIAPYVQFQAMPNLRLGAQVLYAVPEDDEVSYYDTITYLTLGAVYKLNKATTVSLHYLSEMVSLSDEAEDVGFDDDETNTRIVGQFIIKF